MAELLRAPSGREALWTILRYIALVADDSVAATLAAAIPEAKPQVEEALMTLAEKWMADGEAKGNAEGEAKGNAEALEAPDAQIRSGARIWRAVSPVPPRPTSTAGSSES
jgi:hypothetical protein